MEQGADGVCQPVDRTQTAGRERHPRQHGPFRHIRPGGNVVRLFVCPFQIGCDFYQCSHGKRLAVRSRSRIGVGFHRLNKGIQTAGGGEFRRTGEGQVRVNQRKVCSHERTAQGFFDHGRFFRQNGIFCHFRAGPGGSGQCCKEQTLFRDGFFAGKVIGAETFPGDDRGCCFGGIDHAAAAQSHHGICIAIPSGKDDFIHILQRRFCRDARDDRDRFAAVPELLCDLVGKTVFDHMIARNEQNIFRVLRQFFCQFIGCADAEKHFARKIKSVRFHSVFPSSLALSSCFRRASSFPAASPSACFRLVALAVSGAIPWSETSTS